MEGNPAFERKVARERRWFVLERPRRDTNGGSETEVTSLTGEAKSGTALKFITEPTGREPFL